ncbi:MAG: tetratricopeptide repeat protein, partial [Candidatus Sericytochromatia bacterium]|nr:tetratricopeptide repeat protein [Candidatus Tanganyikabacteria bacterium]
MPSSLELGMQAMQEGQPSRAASFFEFALKKAPADPAIRILAADAYLAAEQVGKAEPHVRFLLDQADSLYQRGEYELLARARAAMAKIDAARGGLPGYDGGTAT